jgi:geranylgeranyl diphosphate synthase type II
MARESVEGQAIELGWRRDNAVDLDIDDYLTMILKKTCWYTTIYPCRVGAMIGGADEVDLERITRFGFFLGAAFQIQDDLLNLVGDQTKYGKELGGDIFEGKRTVMLIRLLQVASPSERERVVAILSRDRSRRTAEDVAWVRRGMEAHRCMQFARELAHGLAGAARHEASRAFARLPSSRDRRFLEALPRWVIERA